METKSYQKSILIFGSNGFIGSQVSKVFHEKHWQVTKGDVLNLNKLEEIRQQFSDFSERNRNNEKFMLQAAWYNTTNKDYRTSKKNFQWVTVNSVLMELCVEFNIFPYFIGSCLENITRYIDEYQDSKKQSLAILRKNYGKESFGWLRVYYCYSVEFSRPDLVRSAVESIHNRNLFHILNPEICHDFVHIDDVSSAIYLALDNKISEVVEIGSGEYMTVKEFISKNLPQAQISSTNHGDVVNPPDEGVADISLLLRYSWQPEKSITNLGW